MFINSIFDDFQTTIQFNFQGTKCIPGTPDLEQKSPNANCTTHPEDAAESRQCEKPTPYTEWTQWSSCTPECTAQNDATARTRTRTRKCKNDDDSACVKTELEETENCPVNVCQTCSAFTNYCADRPNTQCVDVEENGVTKASCQCRAPYK